MLNSQQNVESVAPRVIPALEIVGQVAPFFQFRIFVVLSVFLFPSYP